MLMRNWKARLGLSAAVLLLPLLAGLTDARQEGKVKKPEWKHAVAVKVRKAGEEKFDAAKKVGIELYLDPNTNHLLFVSEAGSIAVRPGAPVDGKGKVPEWSHAMELKVRKAGEKEFKVDTKKFGFEVFFETASGQLLYVCETGAVAAVPGAKAPEKAKGPEWSHAMDLKARKAGEKEFSAGTKKYGVEVYFDPNAGNLIYVSETGSLAVVPGQKTPEGMGKDPTWKAAMDLRVRKAREPDFTKDTRKQGVEVYLDENNGNLIFITEMGNLWVTKGTVDPMKSGDPLWQYGLEVDARKADEKEFTPTTQRFGMEVYQHERTGTLLYITETSTLSGAPMK